MTDTPGRLLSSLSNADGKPPKVGGCVGVFFQLFDWNRRLSGKHLFATKSLPAERPQSNKFNDEKLPMAKLLLIADENRGVFPKISSSESQSEVGSEKSSDSGSNKKPGVVARLMGLESFPETESMSHQSKELFFKQQSQQLKQHNKMNHYQELQMLEDLLQNQPEELRRMACNRRDMKEAANASRPFLREEKMPKNTKKAQDPMDKFAKLPLSPKKSGIPFSSILSPSKSNKVTPPIKSQSSRKNSSLLMGAAVRILEPGMQSNRARPLLLDRASDSGDKAGQCNSRFHNDLKRSLPSTKNSRQVSKPSNREPYDMQETKKESARSSTKGGSSSKEGSTGYKCNTSKQQQVPNISIKVQHSSPKLDEVKTSCEDQVSLSEHDDESQSVECDSQASSSKENRNNLVKPQQKPPPRLSRSGSVKEEQPPTPPSRGSLFRSKSVREEAQTPVTPQPLQPSQQDCSEKNSITTPVTSGGKEVRLKREKRQRSALQQSSPEPSVQTSDTVGSRTRKPALDQGRATSRGNLQETQQKSKPSKQHSRGAAQEQNGKSSRLLSYDRIFGNRKQTKNCSNGEASNLEDKPKKSNKEATIKAKDSPADKKSNDNSLMKSLLRRKPLSKAETVSSSKKKVAGDKPPRSSRDHIQHAYERQTRSGGSSPARNFAKETPVNFTQRGFCDTNKVEHAPETLAERNESQTSECDSQHQEEEQQAETGTEVLDGPVFDVSPEKLHSSERMQEKVLFEPDMLADKSLEEILKTILSKSLARQSLGESPLGKGSKTETAVDSEIREEVQLQSTDDATVVDMDVSPIEAEVVSRCDGQQLDDLPSKVLVFEDDEKQATTPLALPLDTGDSSKEASGSAEDGGQPSPVSVLDFLQSPFPSEATTSCEEVDEEGKRNLESDAESGVAEGKTLDAILETYSLTFPDFPEIGLSEETTSCEGQEIEMYVRQVLSASGFANDHSLDSDEEVAAARIPCTEEIFHRLEKQRAVQGLVEFANDVQFCSKIAETPGSCHKLMYDCIGEALDLVLDPFREENAACSGVTSLRHRPYGEELIAEVTGYILSWREMTLGMVDALVEVDMSSAAGKWKEFTKESMEVGVDLERMIFRSVMEDLIFDLVGLRLVRRGLNQPATASREARKTITIQQQR